MSVRPTRCFKVQDGLAAGMLIRGACARPLEVAARADASTRAEWNRRAFIGLGGSGIQGVVPDSGLAINQPGGMDPQGTFCRTSRLGYSCGRYDNTGTWGKPFKKSAAGSQAGLMI